MKFKHNRSKLDYRLRHITAMIGTQSENQTIKELCLLSDDLLAKQEDKPKTWNETIKEEHTEDNLVKSYNKQEDKKEPKGFSVKQLIDFAKDVNDRHLLDTPSPLDSIEEIHPILSKDRLSCYNSKKEIVSKINEIINYLKGKK